MGELLVSSPPAEECSPQAALASPKSQKKSVKGKIVQEEADRTVKSKREDVPIRNIILQDESGKATVTYWRDATEIDARPGDHVVITDVQVNMYNNNTTLQTTMRSKVKKIEAPTQKEVLTVNAIAVVDGLAELVVEEKDEVVSVPAELLFLALQAKDASVINVEEACTCGTFFLTVTSKGAHIIALDL